MPGTHEAEELAECKARIAAIARKRGAMMIDWDFASSLTSNDLNYWDSLALSSANRHAACEGTRRRRALRQEAADSTYRHPGSLRDLSLHIENLPIELHDLPADDVGGEFLNDQFLLAAAA